MRLKKFIKTAEKIKIHQFIISKKSKAFIVAEISGNHAGRINNIFKSIDLIKKSGADAIKIQSYEPDTITIKSKNKYFYINDKSIWKGRYLYDLYKSAYTPFSWHKRIFHYAKKKNLICFSAPFDLGSVDLLEKCGCPAYKIASPEIQDLELIGYVASKKKPVILSTGIANEKDIKLAINECKKNNNNKIILLNCISSYPAKNNELNLKYINQLKKHCNLVGFSDHSVGSLASLGSIAMGAKVIEKHYILNNKIKSEDKSFSMNANNFTDFVKEIRKLEEMLGYEKVNKKNILKKKLKTITRSLFYIRDLKKGDKITRSAIKSIRPGDGLNPQKLKKIIGKKIKINVKKFTPIKSSQF